MQNYRFDGSSVEVTNRFLWYLSNMEAIGIGQRFRKNKLALAGGLFILGTFLVACFAYLLAPDQTQYADLQTVEIQARPPGYRQLFFREPESYTEPSWSSRLEAAFWGIKQKPRLLPVHGYTVHGDSLILNLWVDEGAGKQQYYSLHALQQIQPGSVTDFFITRRYWLGTDKFGRDVLSRLLIGARVSLGVGCIAVFISLLLGLFLGAFAGFYRGKTDNLIQWLLNVTWSIPTLLLAFAFTLALGKGFWQIFVAVGLTMWVPVARLIRGQVMALKQQEFVLAARALGFSDFRILFRHILPNCMGPLMVLLAGNFASAIIVEAGLSFLGIGIQPPQPSWGLMMKEHYNFLITHQPFLALIPGMAIMLLVLAFNLVGNGIRDALDVKSN